MKYHAKLKCYTSFKNVSDEATIESYPAMYIEYG